MNTHWNLAHLQYFRDAIILNSVQLAAKKNNVTHSTISQGIRKLEESMGIKLTSREKRVFKPTQEGLHVFEKSADLINSLQVFESEIHSSNPEPKGDLALACSQSIMSYFLLNSFNKMNKKYPKVNLQLEVGKTSEIYSHVKKGAAEFGITLNDGSLQDMKQVHLHTGKFVLATNKKNKDWKKNGFILTKPRPETILLQQQFRKKEKIDFNIKWTVDSWTMIAKIVEKSNAVALIPDFVFTESSSLIKIGWPLNIHYELILFHLKNRVLSNNALAFIEELEIK